MRCGWTSVFQTMCSRYVGRSLTIAKASRQIQGTISATKLNAATTRSRSGQHTDTEDEAMNAYPVIPAALVRSPYWLAIIDARCRASPSLNFRRTGFRSPSGPRAQHARDYHDTRRYIPVVRYVARRKALQIEGEPAILEVRPQVRPAQHRHVHGLSQRLDDRMVETERRVGSAWSLIRLAFRQQLRDRTELREMARILEVDGVRFQPLQAPFR